MKQTINIILVLLCFLIYTAKTYAQNKTVLDSSSCATWPIVAMPSLTNDGKFVAYKIWLPFNRPIGALRVRAVEGSWIKEFPNVADYLFTSTNVLVMLNSEKTLSIVELGTSQIKTRNNVKSIKSIIIDNKEWLLYHNVDSSLVLEDMSSRKEYVYSHVISYSLGTVIKSLLLVKSNEDEQQLSIVDLLKLKETTIGNYKSINNITFDQTGRQLAFLTRSNDVLNTILRRYDITRKKVFDLNLDVALKIDGLVRFNKKGNQLFALCSEAKSWVDVEKKVNVKVWSYRDVKLKSQKEMWPIVSFLYQLDLTTGEITRIQYKNETFTFYEQSDEWIQINRQEASYLELNWNPKSLVKSFLYHIENKRRQKIGISPSINAMSPDGKFLVGYDTLERKLAALEIETNEIIKLKDTSVDQIVPENDKTMMIPAGWCQDHKLLYYDGFDILQNDLGNKKGSIDLTNGFGRKNNIMLRFAFDDNKFLYSSKEMSVLSAFDNKNKQNGFYQLVNAKDPVSLIMSDNYYYYPRAGGFVPFSQKPVKALNKDIWLVSKESSDSSANFYITSDFKTFKCLSDNYPERRHNWITSELINYTTEDGRLGQATLYKPADFDPSKSYPVIMNYYERKTQYLNSFLIPELTGGHINIPWFVSRGYIVCQPDIFFTTGNTGESALNFVLGAAKYISLLPYIDSNKIGLQGHSFGAYETFYIITHSNFFKAANAGSGVSDIVSRSGAITANGENFGAYAAKMGQQRLGQDLWDDRELYIKNSPIFFADKQNTPLLMMANKNDGIVNVEQGIEFFTSLRRLQKPVWMLQYEKGDHGLARPEDRADYTRKIEDFFGHYLQGKPMPVWMTEHN